MALYKHVIVIWSKTGADIEINDLAQDATDGNSYCSNHTTVLVGQPDTDPNWDGTEFFWNVVRDE